MGKQYDRGAEDVGNIVGLEHVNLTVPDQRLATVFSNSRTRSSKSGIDGSNCRARSRSLCALACSLSNQ